MANHGGDWDGSRCERRSAEDVWERKAVWKYRLFEGAVTMRRAMRCHGANREAHHTAADHRYHYRKLWLWPIARSRRGHVATRDCSSSHCSRPVALPPLRSSSCPAALPTRLGSQLPPRHVARRTSLFSRLASALANVRFRNESNHVPELSAQPYNNVASPKSRPPGLTPVQAGANVISWRCLPQCRVSLLSVGTNFSFLTFFVT